MDESIREVTHGIWCLLATFLALVSGFYAFRHMSRPWTDETQSAVAFGVCMAGAAFRGVWLWALAFYQARDWNTDIFTHTLSVAFVITSTSIAIVGALYAIHVFSDRRGHWKWIVVGAVSIVIPIILHFSI